MTHRLSPSCVLLPVLFVLLSAQPVAAQDTVEALLARPIDSVLDTIQADSSRWMGVGQQAGYGLCVLLGTLQFSNTSSPVSLPLMPHLSSFWATEKPSVSVSTRKAVMPL